MSNGQDVGGAPSQQTPEPPAPVAAPGIPAKEIEEGKAFAILSYVLSFISIPFFLVPLIMRNNAFALYHAKQCLILWIAGAVVAVATMILSLVCIGLIVGPIAGIGLLVLAIMGLISATKGETKPLPLIGKWGEEWFKGIQKT